MPSRSGTGSTELFHVSRIAITDNGHGITPEKSSEAFPSLGDSWKRNLNGRTLNGKRPLRDPRDGADSSPTVDSAFALAGRAWRPPRTLQRIQIEGDQARIDGFTNGQLQPATGPVGTTVINVEQGRLLAALIRDDVPEHLAARLAVHLLGNPDITVRINWRKLDPPARSSWMTPSTSRWMPSPPRS